MDKFGDVSPVRSRKGQWHNRHVCGAILSRISITPKVEFAPIRHFSEFLVVDYR